MSYSLGGFAALGAVDAEIGVQYAVVVYATGPERRKADVQPTLNSMNLRVMSFPNPTRDGDRWRYYAKVLTTVPMTQDAVRGAVVTALTSAGVTVQSATASRLSWPSGTDTSSASGTVGTSDACRARGGVCRDINRNPVQANEQIVRGLCTGPSNIVCVVPRRGGGTGGGSPSPGGGAAPPPITPPGTEAGAFPWDKAILIGGASLFVLALVFTVVKKRRQARQLHALASNTPFRALPMPRMTNRRRRNGVDIGLPTQLVVLSGNKSIGVHVRDKYQVTSVVPFESGALLTLRRLGGLGKDRLTVQVRFSRWLGNDEFNVSRGDGVNSAKVRVTKRMSDWREADLPLPDFTKNRRRRYNRRSQ